MFGVLFKFGLLRLYTVVGIVILLPFLTDRQKLAHSSVVVNICIALWLLCLDKLASHVYAHKLYNFARSFVGLFTMCLVVKSNDITYIQDENLEMLTYLNLINIYICLLTEMRFFLGLVIFILSSVRRKFGIKKPLLYIGYLMLNSVSLMLLVEALVTRVNQYVNHGVFSDSNFRTLVETASMRDRRPILDIKLYIDDIKPCHRGFFREEYVRYTGEDVQLNCNFKIFKSGVGRQSLKEWNGYWVKQGEIFIPNTDRININTDIEIRSDVLWVNMTLNIRFLQPEDFEMYRCVINTTVTVLEQGSVPDIQIKGNTIKYKIKHYEVNLIRRCYVGKFFVHMASNAFENIEIPVGNIAHIHDFCYITQASVDEISFDYNVNGKDIHNICSPDWMSCTLPVIMYAWVRYSKHDKEILKWHVFGSNKLKGSSIEVLTCVCGSFYGEHSLIMYIPYFNSTTRRQEIVEIEHEKKLIFIPTGVLWTKNGTKFGNIHEQIIENLKVKSYVTELICTIQDLNFLVQNTLSYGFMFIVLWLVVRFFSRPTKIYCNLTVVPVKRFIFYGYFHYPPQGLKAKPNTLGELEGADRIHYDMYVSYSPEDYKWSKEVLLPFLEDECGYKVCFPERDLVHEAAKTKLSLFSKATQACDRFIIVVSESYINDPDCNKLQLSTCILPLLHESDKDGRGLTFIKRTPGISIPIQLKWNMNVRTIDWTNSNTENESKIQLKRTLRC